jgi:hypothetical protein
MAIASDAITDPDRDLKSVHVHVDIGTKDATNPNDLSIRVIGSVIQHAPRLIIVEVESRGLSDDQFALHEWHELVKADVVQPAAPAAFGGRKIQIVW